MTDENLHPSAFEAETRRALHNAKAPGGALDGAVGAAIQGRSPDEMNTARTIRNLRGVSGVAAVLLASLLVSTWSLAPSTEFVPVDQAASLQAPAILEFEEAALEETSMVTEATILTAVVVDGMTP